jgi:hypothetical protein
VALQHELAADLEATRAALDAKEKELSDSKAAQEKEIKMLKNKACSRVSVYVAVIAVMWLFCSFLCANRRRRGFVPS